jgi:hypothetical protein
VTFLRSRARVAPLIFSSCISALAAQAIPRSAAAEKVLAKGDDWEAYTDGRVAGFASWTHGDGRPQPTYGPSGDGGGNRVQLHDVKGGGWTVPTEQKLVYDPNLGASLPDQGSHDMMRVRSGMLGNQLGFGVRNRLTPRTKVTGYIQIWAFVESEGRQKNRPNYADVRQGYAKLEGNWGTLLVGRTRALFSRGATDIDVMYAHRWGVGFPGSIDSNGPSLGQIGFGVLGSGFASTIMYVTPVFKGLQVSVGLFDPIQLQGGGWFRTKSLRPEGEATWEVKFGETGKVVLFFNGAAQKVYKDAYCAPPSGPDPQPCEAMAAGIGYGGRFELGPLHLGVAGHYGKGLGLNYALEVSEASLDPQSNLRKFDGYYVQSQLVLGQFDLFAGWGIARVFLTHADNEQVPDPSDATGTGPWIFPHSVIKHQMGINAGVVYNMTPNVHFDADYFRAEAAWFLGEKQVIHVTNAGMTYNW